MSGRSDLQKKWNAALKFARYIKPTVVRLGKMVMSGKTYRCLALALQYFLFLSGSVSWPFLQHCPHTNCILRFGGPNFLKTACRSYWDTTQDREKNNSGVTTNVFKKACVEKGLGTCSRELLSICPNFFASRTIVSCVIPERLPIGTD